MPRPKKCLKIGFDPKICLFKPCGVPLCELQEMLISHAELEALRLKYVLELDQTKSAEIMGVSQSTFQRLLNLANKKVAKALINGMALKISKNEAKNPENKGEKHEQL